MLEVLAARIDAKLQTASHAVHGMAAHSGCDGDKDPPMLPFSLLILSMSIFYQVVQIPALKIHDCIPRFPDDIVCQFCENVILVVLFHPCV